MRLFSRNNRKSQIPNNSNKIAYISYKKINFNPNVIIAIGGGSTIDLAKAMSVSTSFEQLYENFYNSGKLEKHAQVIAIPSTFGTGAEVSFGAILYDDFKNKKGGLRGQILQPDIVFLDYKLYHSAPQKIKALSGFDCLTHAIETYISKKSNSITKYQSVNSILTIIKFLENAVSGDELATSKMSITSMMMGINLAYSSTCLPHRIQYIIGPRTKTSHAEGLAALYRGWLPYIKNRTGEFDELTHELGFKTAEFVDWIFGLQHRMKIDITLGEIGIGTHEISEIADNVSGNLKDDPYYIDKDSIVEILKGAI